MNRVCSIFSQILQFVPRLEFEAAVQKAKHRDHGFASWDQFGAMMFCQLGHAQSWREITGGLASCEGKLKHLGMDGAPIVPTSGSVFCRRSGCGANDKTFSPLLNTGSPSIGWRLIRLPRSLALTPCRRIAAPQSSQSRPGADWSRGKSSEPRRCYARILREISPLTS
jgi:Domain of unknown function (DUF4372)